MQRFLDKNGNISIPTTLNNGAYDDGTNRLDMSANWWDNSDNQRRGYPVYDGPTGYTYIPDKKRHEFLPVLLIFSTVYNCKHCGMNKEDCMSDYCDGSEDDYPDFEEW